MTSLRWKVVRALPISKLARLSIQRGFVDRAYDKEARRALGARDMDSLSAIESTRSYELDALVDDENYILSQKLLRQARRLRVKVPSRQMASDSPRDDTSGNWYQSVHNGHWMLTDDGMRTLRTEIRAERKARGEARAHWIAWLSAITGIIGTLTGLVAVLFGKK